MLHSCGGIEQCFSVRSHNIYAEIQINEHGGENWGKNATRKKNIYILYI